MLLAELKEKRVPVWKGACERGGGKMLKAAAV